MPAQGRVETPDDRWWQWSALADLLAARGLPVPDRDNGLALTDGIAVILLTGPVSRFEGATSGSRAALPPPRPLRTVLATFTAHGSSLDKAP